MKKDWNRRPEIELSFRSIRVNGCTCAVEYYCYTCGFKYNEAYMKENMDGEPLCPEKHKDDIEAVVCVHEENAWRRVIA